MPKFDSIKKTDHIGISSDNFEEELKKRYHPFEESAGKFDNLVDRLLIKKRHAGLGYTQAQAEKRLLVADQAKLQKRIYDFAYKLKVNHPNWPNKRIKRKTEEEFNRSIKDLADREKTWNEKYKPQINEVKESFPAEEGINEIK